MLDQGCCEERNWNTKARGDSSGSLGSKLTAIPVRTTGRWGRGAGKVRPEEGLKADDELLVEEGRWRWLQNREKEKKPVMLMPAMVLSQLRKETKEKKATFTDGERMGLRCRWLPQNWKGGLVLVKASHAQDERRNIFASEEWRVVWLIHGRRRQGSRCGNIHENMLGFFCSFKWEITKFNPQAFLHSKNNNTLAPLIYLEPKTTPQVN